ncbi:nucleotidyltransferase family protein [Erythrobacter mangrovi]|uniref:Nucleotidyltransferase family protein n=1 Tax=Erythrobacter mangrovi TaxID=2739433 RepID=A0A7D3XQW4_9SPHN|nr:nucleotidyltransferase family protein [Erythrobacter mangrovi]QKG70771.1 nucleotidyltransferase family protein [Erythrobacter mangrovi]
MAGPPLEELLTRLAGGPELAPAELVRISPTQWSELDRRATHYRLQPLLHRRWGESASVPELQRQTWASAYRASAISALAHKAELVAIAELLARAGIEAIALKGSWLAWHAWPDPALRPLRDLDLLVPEDAVLHARDLLLGHGYGEFGTEGLAPELWKQRYHQLAPLVSPGGVVVELHHRLWIEDWRTPQLPVDVFGRVIPDPQYPALNYLDPVDQLCHLAVHAAVHGFDGGPLMLADFERLALAHSIDWAAVWDRAAAEGWDRVAGLAIEATRRWTSKGAAILPPSPLPVPPEIIENLPLLLAKPPERIAADQTAARLARTDIGWGEKWRRALARRERHDTLSPWLGWLGGELRNAIAARLGGDTGRGAALVAQLNRYLSAQKP